MDTIVIARTKAEGEKRFPHAVAVVTPRSREAARGITAHRIVVLTSMDSHPDTQELIEACKPALVFKSLDGVVSEPLEPAEPTSVPATREAPKPPAESTTPAADADTLV